MARPCPQGLSRRRRHIFSWLAHRVQRPAEKINHALLLGGAPGIGKDTLLHPVSYAVGAWNFNEVTPVQLLGRFNGFIKSVILRINEARDLGEINRYAFYEHCKPLTAAPPEVLRCDEKNIREYSVPNVTGVIITSNYLTDGCYLPPDDRRHYVAWSPLAAGDRSSSEYFEKLYRWYERSGNRHVAAWLASFDLTGSIRRHRRRKRKPSGKSSMPTKVAEESELADIIDRMRSPMKQPPDVFTLERLAESRCASRCLDQRSEEPSHRAEAAGEGRLLRVANPTAEMANGKSMGSDRPSTVTRFLHRRHVLMLPGGFLAWQRMVLEVLEVQHLFGCVGSLGLLD